MTTPTVIKSKTYVRGFGRFPCTGCKRRTDGKLADYVIGSCGRYWTNCTPLCARCHRRIARAAAAAKGAKQ